MNDTPAKRAGQPLLVLFGLLVVWAGARLLLWHSPLHEGDGAPRLAQQATDASQTAGIPRSQAFLPDAVALARSWETSTQTIFAPASQTFGPAASDLWVQTVTPENAHVVAAPARQAPPSVFRMDQPGRAAENPQERDNALARLDPPRAPVAGRWSMTAWAYYRPDGLGTPAATALRPIYGRSQAGAVLRYDLDRGSLRNPNAFLRATGSLAGTDREVAAGLALRPLPRVPIAVQAEVRLAHLAEKPTLRPAAMAVTEFASPEIPFGLRAETYAAAGYVGGEFATPFVEGQAELTRKVGDLAGGEFRIGAGTWGGAQRGAARLDLGPAATFTLPVADTAMRIDLDYRLRIAGDAAPGSGPTLTVSAGF